MADILLTLRVKDNTDLSDILAYLVAKDYKTNKNTYKQAFVEFLKDKLNAEVVEYRRVPPASLDETTIDLEA